MWYGLTKEFNCKVTSTWSKCGQERETAFSHQQLGEKGKERKKERRNWITSSGQDGSQTRLTSTTTSKYGALGTNSRQEYEASNYFSARRGKKWTDGDLKATKQNLNSRMQALVATVEILSGRAALEGRNLVRMSSTRRSTCSFREHCNVERVGRSHLP